MVSDRLASNFIIELLAYALTNRDTFDMVKAYLKYSYLQREEEKKLVQWLFRNHDKTGRIATIGQLQQSFIKDDKCLELIADIGDVEVEDSVEGHESIIATFQEYLKQMMFLDSNDKIAETYNRGDKDGAYRLFVKLAEEMNNFSILDAKFKKVFGDFDKRMAQRKSEDYNTRFKVPTMIDQLDYVLGGELGGPETGEFCLWLGMSGMGKSQCLVHLGVAAARQGFTVAHIQLEGTEKQCLDRYDAAWTGTLYRDMKVGDITAKRLEISRRIIKKLRHSDIHVDACEDWGGRTIPQLRNSLKALVKKIGHIDVLLVDYLELLEVGDGIRYSPAEERYRREKLARALKKIAMEFNCVVHAATQSNDVNFDEMNDPEFVLSRNNINEARNVVRPTDLFVTINCTVEENKNQLMRLYVDKAREHQGKQIIKIANNFKCSRFYDRKRTQDINDEEEE